MVLACKLLQSQQKEMVSTLAGFFDSHEVNEGEIEEILHDDGNNNESVNELESNVILEIETLANLNDDAQDSQENAGSETQATQFTSNSSMDFSTPMVPCRRMSTRTTNPPRNLLNDFEFESPIGRTQRPTVNISHSPMNATRIATIRAPRIDPRELEGKLAMRVNCFSHVIALLSTKVADNFKSEFKEIDEYMRKIHSVPIRYSIIKNNITLPPKSIVTRWDSSYNMLVSLLALKDKLETVNDMVLKPKDLRYIFEDLN